MGIIDDNMSMSTKVYPADLEEFKKPIEILKLGEDKNLLYPNQSLYKGQLQHTESGARKDSSIEYAKILIEEIKKIKWFNRNIENVSFLKNNFDDIIKRFCSTIWMRDTFLLNDYSNREELYYSIHQSYNLVLRYAFYDSHILEDYISLVDADNFQEELELATIEIIEKRIGK